MGIIDVAASGLPLLTAPGLLCQDRARMSTEPVISSIILSDWVILEHGTAKMSRIGCFNTRALPSFTIPYPGFFVSVGLSNVVGRVSEINITARIEDPATGHVIASAAANMKMGLTGPEGMQPPPELHSLIIDIPIRFGPMIFPKPGVYEVVVLCDNQDATKRPLLIQSAGPPSPAPELPH
jgi:hypothetical protein